MWTAAFTSFQRPYQVWSPGQVLNPGHGPATLCQGTLTWSPRVMAVLSWAQRSLALLLTLLPGPSSTFPTCADPALPQLRVRLCWGGRWAGHSAPPPASVSTEGACACARGRGTPLQGQSLGRLGFKVLSAFSPQRDAHQASGSQQPLGLGLGVSSGAGTFVIKPSL